MSYDCDPTFLADVRRYGKFDVAGCFNCGSCTLSCDLAGDHASFPRRSTRQVLMGLRQTVDQNLDPWICHDCGDCSTTCPRETEPRAAMMTLRRYLSAVYDWTGIASLINSSKAWHLGSLLLVGFVVFLLIVIYHLWAAKMSLADFRNPFPLSHMFPLITYFTWAVVLFPFLILLTNAFRMYLLTVHRKEGYPSSLSHWVWEAKTFFLHFMTYRKMAECPAEKGRWLPHFLLGVGCMVMLLVKVSALQWFQTDILHPLYHPQRWIGYVATVFLIYGTVNILAGRISKKREIHKSSDFSDWNFPVLLLATALSGIIVHICRAAGLELATHYAYAIHLIIAVPMLVVEMPFGKWTHMIYRPLALYFQSLKEKNLQYQPSSEEVSEYVG
jgi:quinone-modifying oxidoreductase subunit QmoC